MRKYIVFGGFSLLIGSLVYSCQSSQEIEFAKYMSNGKDIYVSRCQNCHGEKGEGLGELAPPLTDTLFLKTNKADLACIIKNGSNKEMIIHGKKYDGKMPGLNFADIDIAQVTVYITNSFGNKQGMYTYEQVSKDLASCR
ncbi:c-type cytochrome [Pedobacter sp. Du54]|uniref:c-type cytochrome n=1 Tax=Pedobacter anseongensis TaxID=3133439 RepID=UPI0030B4C25A